MSREFRASMDETRFLGRRMGLLVDAKNALLARNKHGTMEEWPLEDLKQLQDLLVDMAATRERQSELYKITAADVQLIIRKKGAAAS